MVRDILRESFSLHAVGDAACEQSIIAQKIGFSLLSVFLSFYHNLYSLKLGFPRPVSTLHPRLFHTGIKL